MLGLGRRHGGVVGDQPHLDGDLPRRSVGVGADQEEAPAIGQPFVIDALQHTDRIVEMFEHVGQARCCRSAGARSAVSKSEWTNFTLSPSLRFGFLDRDVRSFDTGDVVEIGQASRRVKSPLKLPSSSRLPFRKNGWKERIM